MLRSWHRAEHLMLASSAVRHWPRPLCVHCSPLRHNLFCSQMRSDGARKTVTPRRSKQLFLIICVAIAGAIGISSKADTPMTAAEYNAQPQQMLDAYRHVEAASVSDAIEKLFHQKRYMSHRMQAIFPTKVGGTAVTVLLKPEENHDPNARSGMLQSMDSGQSGWVYVMTIEGGADVAGMGGLMG